MAMVEEVERGRVYLPPTREMQEIACHAKPEWKPEVEICHWPGRTNVVEYGLTEFGDLFTPRQLVAPSARHLLDKRFRWCGISLRRTRLQTQAVVLQSLSKKARWLLMRFQR